MSKLKQGNKKKKVEDPQEYLDDLQNLRNAWASFVEQDHSRERDDYLKKIGCPNYKILVEQTREPILVIIPQTYDEFHFPVGFSVLDTSSHQIPADVGRRIEYPIICFEKEDQEVTAICLSLEKGDDLLFFWIELT